MPQSGESGHFGYREVALDDKQALVDDVFRNVARRYDLMNDLMSGGLHRAWKDVLVTTVNPPRNDQPFAVLDLAGGTGDIAFRLVGGRRRRHARHRARHQCRHAGGRPDARGGARPRRCDRIRGRQRRDVAVPGPPIRRRHHRVRHPQRAADRRRAGRGAPGAADRRAFPCLEFSTVDVPGLAALYDFYSFNAIPTLGRAVAGDADAYRYLVESIRKFPRPDPFAEMIREAGFRRVSFQRLSGGIVALHSGWRL